MVLQQPANRVTTGPGLCGEAGAGCIIAGRTHGTSPGGGAVPNVAAATQHRSAAGRDTDFHPHIVRGNGRRRSFHSLMGEALTLNNLYI